MSLKALLTRLADIHNLEMANAVLNWDQRTYMPLKGGEARAKQLATLAKLSHEMFVASETRDLLAAAEAEYPGNASSVPAATLRNVRRTFDKATRIPTSLIVELTETSSLSEDKWQLARANNDFTAFAPWLEKLLDLKRQYAAAIAPGKPIFDTLLDEFEEGMTAADVDPLFETLKKHAIPLVAAIQSKGKKITDEVLTRNYAQPGQEQFCRYILKECGFPEDRTRLDTSVHPFCTNFAQNDVRITTRWETEWLPGSLFGCLHEMGHGFYELNIHPDYEATPLAGGVSLGVHESQSRLWENLVGRSHEFWERYYPELQKTFTAQLRDVPLDDFYDAINRVSPSLIRVEADEVTYNLHIILRYEMEQALLNKQVSVHDAPAAWNEKMQKYLGLTPPSNKEGILQDVHWAFGGFGYFPTYTVGNVLAAQLFESAEKSIPSLRGDIRNGKFSSLLDWLKTNVHQHGKRYVPTDLVKHATGKPLTTDAYLKYLTEKFTRVYKL
ncbi:MAG TPA: carboxypeptidase M32 [Phycisphaerae bacterium]|nr:carboxypeptidase M32 [Phycisphaerae bacterium]